MLVQVGAMSACVAACCLQQQARAAGSRHRHLHTHNTATCTLLLRAQVPTSSSVQAKPPSCVRAHTYGWVCFCCALQAIHSCALKFPDVAGNVIHLLMDFLGDANTASALDVIFFVREIVETNAKLRPSILERLRDTFATIRCACTCRPAKPCAAPVGARVHGWLLQLTMEARTQLLVHCCPLSAQLRTL